MARSVGQKDVSDPNLVRTPTVVTPTTKRKKTSSVWDEFEEKTNDGDGKMSEVECKHCKTILKAPTKNGTSSMRSHLDNACKIYKMKQAAQNQQRRIDDPTRTTESSNLNPALLREAISEMIILHEYPFSMVEHVGFRAVLKLMQPGFRFFKRNTARLGCMKVYEKEKKDLYDKLGKIQSRIGFTSDFWSSGQNMSYMALTAHYIDDKWKLQKRILCFCNVQGRHTGENVGNVVMEKLYEWNLDRKVLTITLDNAKSNDGVVREILRRLQPKGTLLLNGNLLQVRCCAHILNLIVQDGLKTIEIELEKVRASIKFIKSSPQRQQKFENDCKQINVPSKRFVQDVCTRWNSTYKMLIVALELRDGLIRYAESEPDFKCCPSEDDWKNAKVVADCLNVFYDATKVLSGSAYTTVNRYFDLSCRIYLRIIEWSTSTDVFISKMAVKMKKKFVQYWNITNAIFALSSVLDPRVKMKSVSYYFLKIYGKDDSEIQIAHIRDVLTTLHNEFTIVSSLPNHLFPSSGLAKGSGTSSVSTSASALSGFESYLEDIVESVHEKSDLERYLEDPIHPIEKGKGLDDQGFDILSWWQYNAPKYPIMGKLARDILAIPATSVASESAFSTGGRVVNRYRSTMRPHTIEALICTQDWIRRKHEDGRIYKDKYAFETVDKSIDELEIFEDCGDIVEPEVTNTSASPILDIWDLDEDE